MRNSLQRFTKKIQRRRLIRKSLVSSLLNSKKGLTGLFTFRSRILVTIDVGLIVTSISSIDRHGGPGFSLGRVVGAGVVRAGSPDLGDGDGGDGHKQHDS